MNDILLKMAIFPFYLSFLSCDSPSIDDEGAPNMKSTLPAVLRSGLNDDGYSIIYESKMGRVHAFNEQRQMLKEGRANMSLEEFREAGIAGPFMNSCPNDEKYYCLPFPKIVWPKSLGASEDFEINEEGIVGTCKYRVSEANMDVTCSYRSEQDTSVVEASISRNFGILKYSFTNNGSIFDEFHLTSPHGVGPILK